MDSHSPAPTLSGTTPRPVVVPIVLGDSRISYQVSLKARLAPARLVRSGADGIVTEIFVRPGSAVRPTEQLLAVDDTPILAMGGPAPLFRDLAPGDMGTDVLRLDRFLVSIGRLHTAPSPEFGSSTARAVRDHNFATGRETSGTTFLASSVAWIGPRPLLHSSIVVEVGDRVALDSVILRSRSTLQRVDVAEPPAGVPAVPGGYTLRLGELSVFYQGGAESVTTPELVRRLSPAFAVDREAAATVRARRAAPVMRVPAASVIVDADGTTCVYPDRHGPAVPVTVRAGELGVVDLDPVDGLRGVLANPAQILDELTCGS
ncbi:MAG: hypothetical protein AB7U42_05710 [Nocardioides sp.]